MDENEEQKELEKLLNDMPDEDEGEDEAGQNDKGKENEDQEDENKDKEGQEENNQGESKEGEENEGEEDQGENEDPWKGKSREDVIKSHQELEKKVKDLETQIKGKANGQDEDENKNKDEDKEDNTIPSPEELQKMSPSDFAKWVLGRIDEGVKKTIESQSKVRDAVQKEINEAKKEHNLADPDYRKMVLTIIEAASAKGTVMPLKDACQQVDAFLGKNKSGSEQLSDEEKSRLKKAKAQVESGAGAPTQPDSSDAEAKRIQNALGGSGSKSPLGGLGI